MYVAYPQTIPEYNTVHSHCYLFCIHAAPSGKPGKMCVLHRIHTSAQLSWTPVPKDQQNGIIIGYTVQVAGPDFTREISIIDATATFTEVSGLRPSTSYYFSVCAMTVAGSGPPARSLSITPRESKICLSCTCVSRDHLPHHSQGYNYNVTEFEKRGHFVQNAIFCHFSTSHHFKVVRALGFKFGLLAVWAFYVTDPM